MRVVKLWVDNVRDKDQNPQCIYDLAFHPEGKLLIVTAGSRVLVYDSSDGRLQQTLKGHRDLVYCLSYTRDGSRFASGGADKTVIIWDSESGEGVLKYTHNDSIQCLAYSPVSQLLLSCTSSDIGLWSPEQKSVTKFKVQSRATSCAWTNDGQYFAVGLFTGLVSIRTKLGEEKVRIERPSGQPVWSLSWNPSREDRHDLLTVCDWGKTLSYYHLSGRQIGRDQDLGFDPCCVNYFPNGEFALIGGTNKKVSLYSREGVLLAPVHSPSAGEEGEEGEGSWVWCCRPRPDHTHSSTVAVGCQDGTIALYNLLFSTVHGLYKDRYAYRDHLTDVVVQHLLRDQVTRIKCRDLIKRIAIYKNKLAVALPGKLLVYELVAESNQNPTAATTTTSPISFSSTAPTSPLSQREAEGEGGGGSQYRIIHKLTNNVECSLLVVCDHHIILCQERRLICLSLQGDREREWEMESQVRYIKVVGGPPRREAMLVGLRNGQVLKMFIDNPFPIPLVKQQSPIRCVDLSASRTKLAVVNENSVLMVYDVTTRELLYQEPNASSVAWNSHCEDMLCYSGNNMLSIKASTFPIHQQKQAGFVVGFMASKIFCLHFSTMKTIDVPQSAPMVQYVERKLYKDAYRIACLGVTEEDWRLLALEAFEGLDLEVAKKSFLRLRDLKYLELIHSIEERRKRGENINYVFLADFYAYQSKFEEAAQLYRKAGRDQKAVEMFTDLREFEKAKHYLTPGRGRGKERGGGVVADESRELLSKQAEWARNSNDPQAACDMYLSVGDHHKALEIMAENGWIDRIVNLAHDVDISQEPLLRLCARHLKSSGHYSQVEEVFEKLGDHKSLVSLYVDCFQWENAFDLVRKHPQYRGDVYFPYATWLIENDRFDEAQEALTRAGREEEALHLLEELAENAIHETRFEDAGHYYWLLAKSCLNHAKRDHLDPNGSSVEVEKHVSNFRHFLSLSESYHVYSTVHQFIDQPFTNTLPDVFLNCANYLLHKLSDPYPRGISKFAVLFTLAKHARPTGAFRLARHALEKMQSLRVPANLQESVDRMSLTIRSKPFQDKEDLLPMCYRCSTTNSLLRLTGNACTSCRQPLEFSFVSFEPLPVVEFVLEEGISDEEAVRLIQMEPPQKKTSGPVITDEGSYVPDSMYTATQTLVLSGPPDDQLGDENGPFTSTNTEGDGSEFQPVEVGRSTLTRLHRSEVMVKEWGAPIGNQYYRSVMPDFPISLCGSCNKMFLADDYELQGLCKGHCPFCRTSIDSL